MQFLGFNQILAAHFAKQNTNSVGAKSEGAAEGGCGGNSAAPEPEAKPRRLPEALRAESSKNIFFSLIEKIGGGAQNPKMQKKCFCLARELCERRRGGAIGFVQQFLIK